MRVGTCLHVGCGAEPLPAWLEAAREVRVDVDSTNHPDIVADMRSLGEIGQFDCVYCSHALEHVPRADAVRVLQEFRRVLKPGGAAYVVVPDLEDIRPTDEVVYISPAGPITGADMYWGFQACVQDRPYMKHQFGYVQRTLAAVLREAGFSNVQVTREPGWNLLGAGRVDVYA